MAARPSVCTSALPVPGREKSPRDRGSALVLLIGLKNQIADPILRGGIHCRPQQRKTAPFSVDAVLTCRKRDVTRAAAAAFPDPEADQLQPFEGSVRELKFSVRQLAGRVALV